MSAAAIPIPTRCALLALLTAIWPWTAFAQEPRFAIDARAQPAAPETGYLQMGGPTAGQAPNGRVLAINERHLTLDGEPWLPVMGEFHYSRSPAGFWEEEILKMKAGGVAIVSTYVFWIHHEEVEGRFDWSGQRDLRRFVELCGRHGMNVWMRIGPWAHGEVRNGGLPDWLIEQGPTRVNDPAYLARVRHFYAAISRQLRGLLWKDGGPIIGFQLENEYTNRSAEGGAGHIAKLKQMALDVGFDVPVYTVTGWDNAVYPERIVTPVFGGYPDEPWSGSRDVLPPDTQGVYQFAPRGGNTGILQGQRLPGQPIDLAHYPRFTVELGAGLQLTYHRRVLADPADIPPIALTALGSGVSMLGYYMYHGGTNPDGVRTTLQESQATGYPNDVPVKSYDFQAPLRQYGQLNGSYRKLKAIHQFLADFGPALAPMVRHLPDTVPDGLGDTTTLRVAARTLGDHGFLFFNNYVPRHPMPAQSAVQVRLNLPGQTLHVPAQPITIPAQTAFFWPVNLDLAGATLTYAVAQPIAQLTQPGTRTFVFTTTAGQPGEFVFAAATVREVQSTQGRISRADGQVRVAGLTPSTTAAFALTTSAGARVQVLLLSPAQSENLWKLRLAGREHLLLTAADVFTNGDVLHLRSRDPRGFSYSLLPEPARPLGGAITPHRVGADGVFTRYEATVPARDIPVTLELLRPADVSQPVKMGPAFAWRDGTVAQAPEVADFARAGAWRITVPADALTGVNNVFLEIRYVGDVGRLDAGAALLDDNFYNGTPWEIGLKGPVLAQSHGHLRLVLLPLRRDAPLYLPPTAQPDFQHATEIVRVESVRAIPEYELVLRAQPE